MIIDGAAHTVRIAQEVASDLHHQITHPEVKLIRLDVRIERQRSGASPVDRKESTYWVKPVQPLSEAVVSLANGGELIHLVAEDGQRLDVIFGKPGERDYEPAFVILSGE